MPEHAFSTNDPDHVALYLDLCEQRRKQAIRICADATALGADGNKVRAYGGIIGQPHITGLTPINEFIPEGWRLVRGHLEPRRGRPGEAARAWLDDHQPIDVRGAMTATGLPRNCSYGDAGGFRISTPNLFHHNGTLWAKFVADPNAEPRNPFSDGGCTWEPRKLSEWFDAHEAAEAAKEADGAA